MYNFGFRDLCENNCALIKT